MDESMTPFRETYGDSWLLLAWPGAGQVGMAACSYLIEKLGMEPLARIRGESSEELNAVTISGGLVRPKAESYNQVFGWKNPSGGRNLLLFFGASPPSRQKFDYCRQLVRLARLAGVQRIFSIDAMVTGPALSPEARVFGIATEKRLLAELQALAHPIEPLRTGEIKGINAALFAAAQAESVDTIGLIGEVPIFAVHLPFLRACRAVLEKFATLAGYDWDLADLKTMSERLDAKLSAALEHIEELGQGLILRPSVSFEDSDDETPEWDLGRADSAQEEDETMNASRLDPQELAHIEELFKAVADDRSRALELKAELDRHGLFPEYEDRFLDLFSESA